MEHDEGDAAYVPGGAAFSWENCGEEPDNLLIVGTDGKTRVVSGLLSESSTPAAREEG